MMADGMVSRRTEGTPQGGPLSPLLSNILLTELDRELERRGHAFCRYADDCNIYVKSKEAGQRVMASITRFLADTLKLTVNAAKSAVARPWERKFLGYSLTWHKAPKLKIAPTSLKRLEDKIREVAQRCARAQPDESHRRTQPDPAWLDGLFPADRNQAGAGRLGWLDQAQTALHAVAAVEASGHSRQELDEGRTDGGARISLGLQPTRAVVEQPARAT
jgi:hypothetical protein